MLSTLTGMFLVPLCFCGYNRWFRFVCIWIIFAALTSYIVKRALEKPLNCRTPRLVYKWFYLIHKVSYGMGIVGYCIMMATMFGVNFIFGVNPHSWMDCVSYFMEIYKTMSLVKLNLNFNYRRPYYCSMVFITEFWVVTLQKFVPIKWQSK